ncbi:MAG: hypothetical protein HUJ22_06885 [Gracilimonas sp.]|uniref:hypothetical protein n=1 Tax=Gracilimonas sp. TaxID=1974203 RepID=UPI00198D2749|nr:hypothetical protein [Gracilimonas sp.]MBD3616286.1 hypothetical protein [Gracilimonas sp.]
MKNFILCIVFALGSSFSHAQSLSISETSATQNNGINQYSVAGHQVGISNNSLSFTNQAVSSHINSLTAISAALAGSGVTVHAGNGVALYDALYNLKGNDASAKIYAKLNGAFIVRENIANFLFYDSMGKIKQSVSNSSQSTEGESVSELAADPAFKTIVLYNPKIVQDGKEGSRAKIVHKNWTTSNIYFSSERAIRVVKVSDNGQFIGIVTYRPGTEDQVILTDRFGNDLVQISFDQSVEDVVISDDGEHITLRSNGRVGVYSTTSGERIGSTSFRSRLYFAEYIPEDETLIALTASQAGSVLEDVELHAINISARSIERNGYNSQLSITDLLPLDLNRTSSFRYTLSGMNKTLSLKVQF